MLALLEHRHETSSPKILASGNECCRAVGNISYRDGAESGRRSANWVRFVIRAWRSLLLAAVALPF
jgi:hypothetical protein